jgi:hypothetical protein
MTGANFNPCPEKQKRLGAFGDASFLKDQVSVADMFIWHVSQHALDGAQATN